MYLEELLNLVEHKDDLNAFAKLAEKIDAAHKTLNLDTVLATYPNITRQAAKSFGFHWLVVRYLADDINHPNLHIKEDTFQIFKNSLFNLLETEDFNTAPTKGNYTNITMLFCMASCKRGQQLFLQTPELLFRGNLITGPLIGNGAGWTVFLCLAETQGGLAILQKYPQLLSQENLNMIFKAKEFSGQSGFNCLATSIEGKKVLLSRPELLCENIHTTHNRDTHSSHQIKYWAEHGDLLVSYPKALLAIIFKFREAKALDYFLENIDPDYPQAKLLRTLCKLAKVALAPFQPISFLSNAANLLKNRQSKTDALNVCIELLSSAKTPSEATLLISSFYLINHFPELSKLPVEFFCEFLNRIKEEMLLNKLATLSLSKCRTNENQAQAKSIKNVIFLGLKEATKEKQLIPINKKFRNLFTDGIQKVNFEEVNCIDHISELAKKSKSRANRYRTFIHPKMPIEKEATNDNASTSSP